MLGTIERARLLEYYRRAKVYCQPSRREGLPGALCEAMLCGCYPVVTGTGGMPEAVLRRLEATDPFERVTDDNLQDCCTALEGVSHFHYFVWSADRRRHVSLLELELQAEVDKYCQKRKAKSFLGSVSILQMTIASFTGIWRPVLAVVLDVAQDVVRLT